jgi:CRISPR-associated endonuclease/helicase Cas3
VEVFAHSLNAARQRHLLSEHLHQVAELAACFAQPLGASEPAHLAGLLHDIGKIHSSFQRYLLAVEQNPALKGQGPGHKGAGAVQASALGLDFLAFLIAGHHGGLPSLGDLRIWIREQAARIDVQEAIHQAAAAFPSITSFSGTLPTHLHTPYEHELFIRLLFSALVDADFLDTEHHFIPSRSSIRQSSSLRANMWEHLWNQFELDLQQQPGSHTSRLNRRRHEVLQYCCQAATQKPGFFRLTVPTGGGKTRSSLAFALLHAREHSLQRIIYAIPYLSITEQTADVFRSIFPDPNVVLEHHSGIATPDDPHAVTPEQQWNRLAAENWDAPLIVTTTVQLFESLLAHTPSSCRKLHNLVGSVIILDEAQMLPTHLLDTILEVLTQLVTHYHTTVVLCTATQPALDDRAGFPGLRDVREIIPSPEQFFTALSRVQYHWPQPGERWSWEDVAHRVRQAEQVLVIVNTRADAVTLLQLLSDIDVCHLSTSLCGAHRRVVLQDVRTRLKAGSPCRLIATQLIEAGVDVDFPLVLRALGPLDSIVQAAGRCNREGRLQQGTVIIFEPKEGSLPPGPYRIGTATTKGFLAEGPLDSTDLSLYRRYFERYYRRVNRDEPQVQAVRRLLDYPAIASRFRMIQEETFPVVVPYQHPEKPTEQADLLCELQQRQSSPREILRRLQPYMVNVRAHHLTRLCDLKLVEEILPGLMVWQGTYDDLYGLGRGKKR